jgi:hypothetical protein
MGSKYIENRWPVRRPADEAGPAGVGPIDRTEEIYYVAAAATLIAAVALMAAPALIAFLAMAGTVR